MLNRHINIRKMKNTIEDLAIFGGSPEFSEPVHVGRPNVSDRAAFLGRVNQILDSGFLTNNGPQVLELEQRLAEFLDVAHVVTVCNGTLALELSVRALGLKGEVILPSLTFVATAHSLYMQGITPVFCDVDPLTHNLNPRLVERCITGRTTGILGVHLWGRSCDVENLQAIAEKYNLVLLFDAAHAFACSRHEKMIGNFGQAEIFSFHATKFFHTFEGGAVATNDAQLAERLRLLRNFGFAGFDKVVSIGTNAKMSEISAAMGLTLLDDLESIQDLNKKNYDLYASRLGHLPGFRQVHYDPEERNNYQYIVFEIEPESAGLSRDQLAEILWAENIRARRYFFPGVHRMEPYQTNFPRFVGNLPVTERLVEQLIALPNGTRLNDGGIQAICDVILLCIQNAGEIKFRTSIQDSQGKKSHPG